MQVTRIRKGMLWTLVMVLLCTMLPVTMAAQTTLSVSFNGLRATSEGQWMTEPLTGTFEVWSGTTLLGQVTARQKMQLVLRLNLPFVPGDANLSAQTARRLLELQAWVAEQSAAGFAPRLGNADPVQETLTAGAARLEQANDEGSAVYTVTLTAHYTMKWSDTFED